MDDASPRIGRGSFFFRSLGTYTAASLCLVPFALSKPSPDAGVLLFAAIVLMTIASVVSALEGEKRLHDMGRSGGLAWLLLIPPVQPVMMVVLSTVPGQPTENSYGPTPGQAPEKLRIGRAAFFGYWVLFAAGVELLPRLAGYLIEAHVRGSAVPVILPTVLLLVLLTYGFVVQVQKRLRDMGSSQKRAWLLLVPVVNSFFLLSLVIGPGKSPQEPFAPH